MLNFLVIAAAYAACRYIPRLVSESVATLVALLLLDASRRARHALVAAGSDWQVRRPAWDRQPTHDERRLLRESLRATMRSTVLVSLLPDVAARANSMMR